MATASLLMQRKMSLAGRFHPGTLHVAGATPILRLPARASHFVASPLVSSADRFEPDAHRPGGKSVAAGTATISSWRRQPRNLRGVWAGRVNSARC